MTTEEDDFKQQTALHNHAVDVVDTQGKAIQSDMRKRAREEPHQCQQSTMTI